MPDELPRMSQRRHADHLRRRDLPGQTLGVVPTDLASALLRRRAPDGVAGQLAGQTSPSRSSPYADFIEHVGLELLR